MNVWMRRSAGIVIISAGIVAAGATAASANTPPGPTPTNPFQGQWTVTQQGNVQGGNATTTTQNSGAFNGTAQVQNQGGPSSVTFGYGSGNFSDASARGHNAGWSFAW